MSTQKPMPSIRGSITKLVNATIDYAYRGAAHPGDRRAIEHEFFSCREELERLIEQHLKQETPDV